MEAVAKQLEAVSAEIKALHEEVKVVGELANRAASNSAIVLSGYHEHGTVIELMARKLDKLSIECPLIKVETGEYPKVESK
jgi:hypothetical protein